MTDIKQRLDQQQAELTASGANFEIVAMEVAGQSLRALKHAPQNLRQALDQGRQHGDQEAIVYLDERWSYNDVYAQADAVAHQLIHQRKLAKGSRVAIAMRNYPEWMSAFIGIVSAGCVAVPVNSWGQRDELLYGLTDSGAQLVFCDQRRYQAIADQLADIDCYAVVVRPDTALAESATVTSMETFVAPAMGRSAPEVDIAPGDYAMMLYTSGTTGRPKGAISTHLAVCQSVSSFELSGAISAMANMSVIEKMLSRGYPATGLLAVPLFHTSGLYANFILALRAGTRLVMMYKWDTGKALELIERERITLLSMVPAILWELLNHPAFDATDTSSLFMLGSGGSSAPAGLKQSIIDNVSDAFPGTGYGSTETNASVSSITGEAYINNPKSAGVITPLVQVKFCDENGNELPTGERGEIWVRSITMIDKYWNRPEDTDKAFQDGWFLTGDVGYLDEQGYLYIVDRIKDMVIRGGENIYCVEVENVIYEHSAILEAAVFGVPHDTLGEELAVAIVLKPGQTMDQEQLQAHAAKQLAAFKVPAHVIFRDQPLPRNATKKVLKKQLQIEFSAG